MVDLNSLKKDALFFMSGKFLEPLYPILFLILQNFHA